MTDNVIKFPGARQFAAALRKAKADGMREAAFCADEWGIARDDEGFRKLALSLVNRASAIEKGNA